MEVSPTAQLLTSLFGYARDLTVIGFIILLSWKARGIWDSITAFIDHVTIFMASMTQHADTLVSNHLNHLQKSADQINKKLDDQTQLLTEIKDRD
jgi:uncharacterized membrane protein required for colicin V production